MASTWGPKRVADMQGPPGDERSPLPGRPQTSWAMRPVADATHLTQGPISLVLVLAFAATAMTQALGLHALLGAFALGVLLGRAPQLCAARGAPGRPHRREPPGHARTADPARRGGS